MNPFIITSLFRAMPLITIPEIRQNNKKDKICLNIYFFPFMIAGLKVLLCQYNIIALIYYEVYFW